MKTIDLKIQEIKDCYKNNKPIIIENINYHIGLICGAINEFRLYSKGKEYIVFSDYKKNDTTFIILKNGN